MQVYAISDIGKVRKINEDSFYHDPDDEGLFIVADGMGGHQAGEVASAMAVATLSEALTPSLKELFYNRRDTEQKILKAVDKANRTVYEKATQKDSLSGMGTTVVVCLIVKGEAHIAHIGDSRCYLLRDGQLTQLTEDHSLVQELLKKGRITEEEALVHPRKNILTRALGTDLRVEPDYMSFKLKKEDVLILCTDGVTNHILPHEILEFTSQNTPQEACLQMVQTANERGGHDNMTVMIVRNTSELEGK